MGKAITTLRLPEEDFRMLKTIAGYEHRSLTDIFTELAEEYIERHRETLELLNIPGFTKECRKGLEEVRAGGGKELHELED
jgi:hypothetical protein